MNKIDIAGLKVDATTKQEFLDTALARAKNGQKTFVITPYSEFLYHALEEPALLDIFNSADFALADGIGIFWARRYLSLPLTAKSYFGKILQALWQMKYSLASIIFYPRWIKNALPEKIPGADLIWDLAELAAQNNLSIYLLGGFDDTPKLASEKLKVKSAKLKIAGWSNKNPDDASITEDINKTRADLLFVAYGPVSQEKWIAENLSGLNVKLAIGLGGTFDYIAGKKYAPPKIVRYSGLEWLWRLLTQPRRIKRIFQATFGLVLCLWRYKVFTSFPFRDNVALVILNSQNQVLIVKRSSKDKLLKDTADFEKIKFSDYWQLPQGGVNKNEDLVHAAQREAFEELSLKNLKFLKFSSQKNCYIWDSAKRPLWFNKYQYKGQQQSIAYLRFEGSDEEILVDDFENETFKWISLPELADSVHEERHALAKIVLQDLKEMAEKGIIDM